MKQHQCDDLIDRYNASVTHGRRKQLAKFGEGLFGSFRGSPALRNYNRNAWLQLTRIKGITKGRLQLNSDVPAQCRRQPAGDDKFPLGKQGCWNVDFQMAGGPS